MSDQDYFRVLEEALVRAKVARTLQISRKDACFRQRNIPHKEYLCVLAEAIVRARKEPSPWQ